MTTPDIYAFIAMEEFPDRPQRVGFKQALCPAGYIPLVVMDYDLEKITRGEMIEELQQMANQYGHPIRLARFAFVADELVIEPQKSFE